MDQQLANFILNWAFIGLSLIILLLLGVFGALRERTLKLGPERDLGLDRAIYVGGALAVSFYVGAMLMLGGLDQPVAALGLMFIPFALVGVMISLVMNCEAGFRKIGLLARRPGRDIGWSALAIPASFILASGTGVVVIAISTWAGHTPDPIGHKSLQELIEDPSIEMILGLVLTAVLIMPALEELVFRGILQTSLVRLMGGMRWPALLITAALFSITHAWVVPWQNLMPLFVLGLVFGYVYERTGSLLTPILTHAGFNAINIAIVLMMVE